MVLDGEDEEEEEEEGEKEEEEGEKYGKPLWTILLKLPHSVPISSRANSIPKTHKWNTINL